MSFNMYYNVLRPSQCLPCAASGTARGQGVPYMQVYKAIALYLGVEDEP